MSIWGDLERAGILSDGLGISILGFRRTAGKGKFLFVDGTNGSDTNSGRGPGQALITLDKALSKMTANNNDIAYVIGATTAISQAAALDWNLNFAHIIGEGAPGFMNQRARLSQDAAYSPFVTVSGYGNLFQSLYLMQGTASATNLIGLSVTGARNTFKRVHVLPQDATAMDEAGFHLVSINNSEQTWEECVLGCDTVAMSAGSLLKLGATGDGGPPRTIFKDCLFLMYADAAAPFFIDASLAGLGRGMGIFLNCQFINVGTSLTYAISGAGLNNYQLYFDNRCSFAGVTDIVAAGYENYVWFGGTNLPIDQVTAGASVALFNGLATHPDVS